MNELVFVVGARPNFAKVSPIIDAIRERASKISVYLVHTGQHYDQAMKTSFFEQLGLPEPDVDLEVGSGSHAVQTAEIMKRFEPVLDERKASAIVVVGDVNSTIACALVAIKKHVPVFHVEAGLRSNDREMPEEINRILTDQISDLLFTTERGARVNLEREGISADKVHFVGNVMIDTLFRHVERAPSISSVVDKGWLESVAAEGFSLLTLHRPSNVDDKETFSSLLGAISELSRELPVIFPIHPRTRLRIEEFGLGALIDQGNFYCMEPMGYLQLLSVLKKSKLVLTDSGGIQEETTALGIPCLTLRENTERPITISEGTNTMVGVSPEKISNEFRAIMDGKGKEGRVPELWDGKAAHRIVDVMEKWLEEHGE